MRSIREQQQFETAKNMPAEVLAAAVIDQAKNCVLSEAMALEIAGQYNFAAEIARHRRVLAAKRKK